MSAKQVPLGTVSGLYGVQGWVKVFSETAPRENIFQYQPWVISGSQSRIEARVLNWRSQGKTLIAKLDGVDSREQARLLIGSVISVSESSFPVLDDEEYYWHQLIGCQVVCRSSLPCTDESGIPERLEGGPEWEPETRLEHLEIGTLVHFMETGANDVMVVETKRGEHLIPWIPGQVVQRVDLNARVIQVDWDPDY